MRWDVVERPASGDVAHPVGAVPGGSVDPASAVSRRRRSLDGLRCVAVLSVLVYHAEDRYLPGGFVGVDVFFALSGYLITALLVAERSRTGRVALGGFWMRRVRRLWPLAWLTLAAVAAVGLLGVWGDDRERLLPVETLAALANVSNWWQMANGGYVTSGVAPSPLRHFWSLAVEEQFYLLWPLLLVGLLALGRRRGRAGAPDSVVPAAVGVVVLFVASAVSAWVATPTVAYLGTHTRAVALLAGAALALLLRNTPLGGPATAQGRWTVRVLGALGTVVLVVVAVVASPQWPLLHRGGFALVAVASASVVALALVPGWPRSLLALAPVVWIGRRSFAIYLIHWPLVVAVGPEAPGWVVLGVVLPTSVVLAALAHRLVERPVQLRRLATPRLLGAGLVVLLVTGAALWWGRPTVPTVGEQVAASLERVEDPVATSTPEGPTSTTVPCIPTAGPTRLFLGGTEQFDASTVEEVADPAAGCASQTRVLVLGDSLGRSASNGLVSLGRPELLVWDRTSLGCSFATTSFTGEPCPDWREAWPISLLGIQPDVVLVFSRTLEGLTGDDLEFTSAEAEAARTALFAEAAQTLGATGAQVLFVTSAPPGEPNGRFYCDGRTTGTPCDPAWAASWNRSLVAGAAAGGAGVVDAAGWTAARSATDRVDRPDGLHYSGGALFEHATWLADEIRRSVVAP